LTDAALGLFSSARLPVASTRSGVTAVSGQVGEELPPGGMRTCPTTEVAGAWFDIGFYWTANRELFWVRALDARARASDCQDRQKR
jgi:hypothetical protein